MFHPAIRPNTLTPNIVSQVTSALEEGQTVCLGRWTGRAQGSQILITRFSEESRNGPLVGPVPMGSAAPAAQGAYSLVHMWLGDWS